MTPRRTIRAWSVGDLWLLPQIWIGLLVADVGLRCLSLPTVQRLLRWMWRPAAPAPADAARAVPRWARLVEIAARRHLYPMRCLHRALVLQAVLSGRRMATELRIGVERTGSGLGAHAWLEHEGRPIAQPPDTRRRFTPLLARESPLEERWEPGEGTVE